jgi:hypothetical protein
LKEIAANALRALLFPWRHLGGSGVALDETAYGKRVLTSRQPVAGATAQGTTKEA